MKPDRSNYEKWFLDRLDGNLNQRESEQLDIFLSENPDLKEELADLKDLKLVPPQIEYPSKSSLNKSSSEITDNQFDFLCIGFVENDLNQEEADELFEVISANPQRKAGFELFQRTKLTPPEIIYRNKGTLIRKTPFQKIIRMSAVSLSAAATVAIMVIAWLNVAENNPGDSDILAKYMNNDGRVFHSLYAELAEVSVLSAADENLLNITKQSSVFNNIKESAEISSFADKTLNAVQQHSSEMISSVGIPNYSDINLIKTPLITTELIQPSVIFPGTTQQSRALGKYLAKTFRTKILKEDTLDESPVKGFEIAEAGVNGINKLLGWQMAFEKNSDENGEVKSVYFSSKILKVQAPVNKQAEAE